MVDVSATPANEGTLCQYCDTLAQGTCYHCGAGACPRHSVLGVMVGLYVRGRLCNLCFWRIGEVCSIDDVTSGDEALGIQEDTSSSAQQSTSSSTAQQDTTFPPQKKNTPYHKISQLV